MGTHFSTIAKRSRLGPVDANLVLRDIADGAEAATAAETGIALDVRAQCSYKVALSISAAPGTIDGSNYWDISVEVSDALAGTYTSVGSYRSKGGAEQIEIPVSGDNIAALDADSAFMRVNATKTGTTATSITYGAWVVPT